MAKSINRFYSKGKLLITAEYAVLEGVTGLAIPSKLGQDLCIHEINSPILTWNSYDIDGNIWYQEEFKLPELTPKSNNEVSQRLIDLFRRARQLNPSFLRSSKGFLVQTHLEFDRLWGLGTSSTLVNNVAQWAQVDAFDLQKFVFGGSGYDIACAQADGPILFSNKSAYNITPIVFNPPFLDRLFLIYLNQKQNSRDAIQQFKTKKHSLQTLKHLELLTHQLANEKNMLNFQHTMHRHESLVRSITGLIPVQERLFPDYNGAIKSLGAWGGDFILACGDRNTHYYFKQKGYAKVYDFTTLLSLGT